MTSPGFEITRAGSILAVADLSASLRFYRDQLGLTVDKLYDDPPYVTFTAAGARISLAQHGYDSPDRPGVAMAVPDDPARANVVLVLEVPDAQAVYDQLSGRGVKFLAEVYRPPWGGCRFFCVDPDGYLVEIEEMA